MVGRRHIPPSTYVKLKDMNPTLPSKSLKQFYWENEEVQKGLEGNYNNWKAYNKGKN